MASSLAPNSLLGVVKTASKGDIYAGIYEAIIEHRLMPGTKLSEEKVAELFSVSRTQVRGVFQRLAVEQLITLVPNRGAFVTTPTVDEAQEVFEARRVIEPVIVRRVVKRIAEGRASGAVKALRVIVEREKKAHANEDRRAAVRLSGEFHVLLAQLSGSSIMMRMMRELTPLTCLAILAFEAPTQSACPNDEHECLTNAIEAGREDEAAELMLHHLAHIEASLALVP